MESVYLAGKAWLLPATLWLAVGLATVWWAYRGASMDRHIRGACMGLKCLGLLLLLLCSGPLAQTRGPNLRPRSTWLDV